MLGLVGIFSAVILQKYKPRPDSGSDGSGSRAQEQRPFVDSASWAILQWRDQADSI